MGQARRRGTFEERRKKAVEFVSSATDYESKNIDVLMDIAEISGKRLTKSQALKLIRDTRKDNDETMNQYGYSRLHDENGLALSLFAENPVLLVRGCKA